MQDPGSGTKDWRARVDMDKERTMDGFGSQAGTSNFLRAWMVNENTGMVQEDWLSGV